jgi:hypothetical protein
MGHCEQRRKEERAEAGERNTLNRGKEMRHKGHNERRPHKKKRKKITQ